MKFNYELSNKVLDFIENAELEEISIGCSNSQVFKIKKEDNIYFLKVADKGILTSEYEKLKWLDCKLNVPKIVLYDLENDIEYLITEGLKGEMLCSNYFKNNPMIGIKVIANAFKHIYSLDINNCPFDSSIDYWLSKIEGYINDNLIKEKNIKEDVLKKFGSIDNIFKYLKENKFEEELCFSHGDPSLPNIFSLNDEFSGLIDVGQCGIADKWFDLAICEKSIIRNYGKEYVSEFYKELNIIPKRTKIDYFILMLEVLL